MSDEPFTIDKLRAIIEAARVLPPDPLNGATELVAAPSMIDDARKLAAAAAAPGPFGVLRLTVRVEPWVPPGYIFGLRRGDIVLSIGPETPA